MLARLWWKETRQFWPIWAFLGVIALGVQAVVLSFVGKEARTGSLGLIALGWAALYGCAAGAAAIAGEKESRTLAFLDAQGLGRGLLWRGKASFAIGSTLVLAALLFGLAALGTDHWETGKTSLLLLSAGYAAVLLEVVGWGLLWSSATGNPLIAAILTICCLAVSGIALSIPDSFPSGESAFSIFVAPAPLRLTLAAATTIGSYLLVVAGQPGRGRRASRRTTVIRLTVPDADNSQSPRRFASWRPAVRVLVWQTIREAAPVWWRLAALAFGVIVLVMLLDSSQNLFGFAVALSWPIGVIAGVSVFGIENRARTYRFLTHHGARPGTVWMVKTVVWGCAVTALALPVAILRFLDWPYSMLNPRYAAVPSGMSLILIAILLATMSVGMLCGMVVRRGITAVVVAAAILIASAIPLVLMYEILKVIPAWGFVIVPLGFLFVSWAWSADWMYERPGAGRWARLAFSAVATSAVAFTGYAAYRVYSVPMVNDAILSASLKPDPGTGERASQFYDQAVQKLNPPYTEAHLAANAEALALTRRAAALPDFRVAGSESYTWFTQIWSRKYEPLSRLLVVSARARLSKGDLAGAWDDVLTLLHMARNLRATVPLRGLMDERQALMLALEWAADSRQTPALLRSALKDYHALPAMPTMPEITAVEAATMQRTLRMRHKTLVESVAGIGTGPNTTSAAATRVWADVATTPWELARARRAFRLLFTAYAANAALEPTRRPTVVRDAVGWPDLWEPVEGRPGASRVVVSAADLLWIQSSTPLASRLMLNLNTIQEYVDRNEVMRRALVQVLALRRWQLRHDGRLPKNLLSLLADDKREAELAWLPLDPYTGKHFLWVPSEGQPVPPLGRLDASSASMYVPSDGARLLYSAGPDRVDGRAWPEGDIVFPLQDKPGAVPKQPGPPLDGFPAAGMGAAGGIALPPPLPDPAPPPDGPPRD